MSSHGLTLLNSSWKFAALICGREFSADFLRDADITLAGLSSKHRTALGFTDGRHISLLFVAAPDRREHMPAGAYVWAAARVPALGADGSLASPLPPTLSVSD